MKHSLMIGAAALLVSSPALAIKITNLDHVPHKVMLEAAGSREVHALGPDDTVYITGQPGGFISLVDSQNPKPSKGPLHADGVLSGIIGAERTQDIPTDPDDAFVIWPGGKLSLQQRMRTHQQNR